MRYAQVSNGKVINVVEQDSAPEVIGEWVATNGARCGPGYDYANGTFTAPNPRRGQILNELARIDALSDSPRARREAALGDLTYLNTLETQAEALRTELAGL